MSRRNMPGTRAGVDEEEAELQRERDAQLKEALKTDRELQKDVLRSMGFTEAELDKVLEMLDAGAGQSEEPLTQYR